MKKIADFFKALFWLVFILGTGAVVVVKVVEYLKKNKPQLLDQLEDKMSELETVIPQLESVIEEVSAPIQETVNDVKRTVAKDAKLTKAAARRSVKQVRKAVTELTERQQALLQYIQQYEQASMSAFKDQMKDVTDRTLRRDLAKLEAAKLITKHGSTKSAYYKAR